MPTGLGLSWAGRPAASGCADVDREPSGRSGIIFCLPEWMNHIRYEELPGRLHFEFPGKVAFDNIQQGAVLRKKLLKLFDNAQRDLGQQAVALGDQMGQIAHVQIRFCAAWFAIVCEEMEGANLPSIDGFHFAAQFQRDGWHAMGDAPVCGSGGRALHQPQNAEIDEHSALRQIIGREDFHLLSVGKARTQGAKGWVEQNRIVNNAYGPYFASLMCRALPARHMPICACRVGSGSASAHGCADKLSKGAVVGTRLDLDFSRAVDLAGIRNM